MICLEEITTDFVTEKQDMLKRFDEYTKVFTEELRVRQSIEKSKLLEPKPIQCTKKEKRN